MKSMNTQKMVRLSLLISLATVLSILENQLPIPRPLWLKLGLANIATIIALVLYGIRAAAGVALLRCLLAGIFGTLPMLIFSLPGALASALGMGMLYRISGSRFSIIGLSVAGAVSSNMAQLLVAYFVLKLSSSSISFLAPILILAGIGAGLVTGFLARQLLIYLHIEGDKPERDLRDSG